MIKQILTFFDGDHGISVTCTLEDFTLIVTISSYVSKPKYNYISHEAYLYGTSDDGTKCCFNSDKGFVVPEAHTTYTEITHIDKLPMAILRNPTPEQCTPGINYKTSDLVSVRKNSLVYEVTIGSDCKMYVRSITAATPKVVQEAIDSLDDKLKFNFKNTPGSLIARNLINAGFEDKNAGFELILVESQHRIESVIQQSYERIIKSFSEISPVQKAVIYQDQSIIKALLIFIDISICGVILYKIVVKIKMKISTSIPIFVIKNNKLKLSYTANIVYV